MEVENVWATVNGVPAEDSGVKLKTASGEKSKKNVRKIFYCVKNLNTFLKMQLLQMKFIQLGKQQ